MTPSDGRGKLKREGLLVFAAAVGARAAVTYVGYVASGHTLAGLLQNGDAPSYLALADTLTTGLRPASPWDERVFWGWPILLSVVGKIATPAAVCIPLSVLCSGLAAVVFYRITRSLPIGLLYATVPPNVIKDSTLALSEPSYLLCVGLALWALGQGRHGAGALAASAAAVIRPTAFLLLGSAGLGAILRGQPRRAFIHAAGILAGMLAIVALNYHFYGSGLRQLGEYALTPNIRPEVSRVLVEGGSERHFLNVPFVNMVRTSLLPQTPAWKLGYIYGIVAWIGAALYLNARPGTWTGMPGLCAVWGAANLLVISTAGPYWAFHSFDRYATWALPAYWYPFAKIADGHRRLVGVVCVASVLAAAWAFVK